MTYVKNVSIVSKLAIAAVAFLLIWCVSLAFTSNVYANDDGTSSVETVETVQAEPEEVAVSEDTTAVAPAESSVASPEEADDSESVAMPAESESATSTESSEAATSDIVVEEASTTTDAEIVAVEETTTTSESEVSSPKLSTDKGDYHPSETATIFGNFFTSLQSVVLKIFGGTVEEENYTESTQTVTADEEGSFTATYNLDIVYRPFYNIVASTLDGVELATLSFLDSPVNVTPLEVDGNAIDNAGGGTDWNTVIGANCDLNETGGGVTKGTCVTDPTSGDEGFHTGGSKDINDISQWGWSAASGTQTPPKNNIVHAFGAVYATSGEQILYFGLDREPNNDNGNNTVGFWFLQNKVVLGGDGTFDNISGGPAIHTEGDLHVVAEFTNGGAISNLQLNKWQGGVLVNVFSTNPGTNTGCNPGAPTNGVCVGVNNTTSTLSWAGTVNPSIFFEGGINLTDLGFATNSCLAQFIAETRSSQSNSAQLHDFAMGDLSTCGTITIVKDTVPNDTQDFSFTTTGSGLSSFSLDDDGETTILSNTKTFANLFPGSYSVTEGLQAGYSLTGLSCTDPTSNSTTDLGNRIANINVGASETVSCTYTNTLQTGHLVVQKTTLPAADPTVFSINATGTSPITGGGAGTITDALDKVYEVTAGTYSVAETVPSGWTKTGDTCQGVSVSAGATSTCLITNAKDATLTLVKNVINDNGGNATTSDFQGKIDGTNVPWNTAQVVSAATHTASETTLSGYTASVWGGDCAANGSVTLNPGDAKTCTITNNDDPAKIVLKKVVINDNGGIAGVNDFGLTVGGASVNSGATTTVNSNTSIVLNEVGLTGYTFVSLTGDAKCPQVLGGTVNLDEGETVVCTITNNDIAPQLTVIKHVINDNGGTAVAGDFTMNVAGTNVSSSTFPGSEVGTTTTLNAGAYSVSENTSAGYASSTSADCVGTIAVGESKTCTITNDDLPATLIVKKVVINDNGGTAATSSFSFQVNGAQAVAFEADGQNDLTVNSGVYSVTEPAAAGYETTYNNCTNLVIPNGGTATCTITNNDIPGHLIVHKVTNPSSNTTTVFSITANGGTVVGSSTRPIVGGGSVDYTVYAGTYNVSEAALAGWAEDVSNCQNVVIALGETKECTVTNTKLGTITIVKDAQPNDLQNFAFSGTLGAFSLDDDAGVVGEDNVLSSTTTFSNLTPAQSYTITETQPNAFWTNTGIACVNTGTATPYQVQVSGGSVTIPITVGADVTCTFTNVKQSPTRTLGFWQTHTAYTSGIFSTNLGSVMPIGIAPHKGSITTTSQLFGGFYASIPKTTSGAKRTDIDKARIQLLQQLIAAKLNCAAFGCATSVQTLISTADTAYASGTVAQILASASALDAYNNSGDTIIIGSAGNATPKTSQSIADLVFWNLP
ncbi:MAG: hypothetical protein V4664_03700 [Patescibacteria group bacterium]